MRSPYKRRRRSLVRNLWVYRRVVALAGLLGLILWFIVINRDPVNVSFPFGLGTMSGTSGVAILLGMAAGSAITALGFGTVLAVRGMRREDGGDDRRDPGEFEDDRPPTDYAAKTGEGFSDASWRGM